MRTITVVLLALLGTAYGSGGSWGTRKSPKRYQRSY